MRNEAVRIVVYVIIVGLSITLSRKFGGGDSDLVAYCALWLALGNLIRGELK